MPSGAPEQSDVAKPTAAPIPAAVLRENALLALLDGKEHTIERLRLATGLTGEIEALRGALAAEAHARGAAEAQAAHLAHEVTALRHSWSWRITAPLRRLFELLTVRRIASTADAIADSPRRSEPTTLQPPVAGEARLLLILEQVLTPSMDSGSFRTCQIIRLLVEMGHRVTVGVDTVWPGTENAEVWRDCGVAEVVEGRAAVFAHLREAGSAYRVVVLSRPDVALAYLVSVRGYANQAAVVYDTVDLHGIRLRRQGQVTGDASLLARADRYEAIETFLAAHSDVTLAVSEDERRWLLAHDPALRVDVVSNIHPIHSQGPGFEARSGLLFIGDFAHPPNEDAIVYFADEILPILRQTLPDVTLTVLGSHMPPRIAALAAAGIDCVGYVADPSPYFERARVFVAPLRFGAGVKGKIGHSMSHGLPVVTTSVGAEGLNLVDRQQALVGDGPDAFARAIEALYVDAGLWQRIASVSAAHIDGVCGVAAARATLGRLVPVGGPP